MCKRTRRLCISRKLVLSAYNQIRGRLRNSQLLSEQTDLALYSLNETTLTKWLVKCNYLTTTIKVDQVFTCLATYHGRYKNKTRQEKIKTLIQGKSLPVQYPQARVLHRLLPLLSPGLQRRVQTRMTLWARPTWKSC